MLSKSFALMACSFSGPLTSEKKLFLRTVFCLCPLVFLDLAKRTDVYYRARSLLVVESRVGMLGLTFKTVLILT